MPKYNRMDAPTRIADYAAATPTEVRDFLALARQRFKIAVDAESEFRNAALDDLRFLTGEQWPEETKRVRDASNRPCLTINRLPAIKSQLVNEQRSQRPAIVVKPVGDGSDVDTAEMLEGLVRHIQVNSDAEIAFDTGFEHMVSGGKGYIEICRDYLPGETFDQELYIKRIKNPFTIYCDPSSIEPDESDANWKFKICDYPKDEYLALFKDTQLASLSDFSSIGDNFQYWGDSKTIRVAEYWHKEWDYDELYKLKDGTSIRKSLWELRNTGIPKEQRQQPIETRDYRRCRIVCSVINAIEVIDEYTFPGKVGFIPLVPCLGEDFDVNGHRKLYGIVRNAKDSQRAINYFRSYAAETIALAPKAPWIGWKGQFKDAKWNTANVINYAYLEADPVTLGGEQAPSLPQRNQFEPPIQAILAMGQVVDGDLKAVTGIYEPTLGQTKGDQSGKAIDLLQKQGGLTNLNYTDNLSRCLRAVGRVLLDAAPFIYDAPRVQRIINPDGSVKHVIVHSGREQAAQTLKTPEIQDVYDLSLGSYDAIVDVGPSWKSKRQEAFAMQLQLAEADRTGTIMKVAPDIIVANSDMPGSREIADRLRKTLPPGLLDEDSADPAVKLQQATAMVQQLQQHNQELMKQNTQMMETIKEDKIQAAKDIQIAEIRKTATIEAATIAAKIDSARLEFEKFTLMHEAANARAQASVQQQQQQQQQPQAEDNSQQQPPQEQSEPQEQLV